jgi:hypothetical protein
MSKKSKWFLGLSCAAMIVALTRTIPAIPIGRGVSDFSAGLAAALMFCALVSWKNRRRQS